MIAINLALCHPSFVGAFEAMKGGHAARRVSWPVGQHIKPNERGSLVVVREGSNFHPPWAGPSSGEMDADDWEVLAS